MLLIVIDQQIVYKKYFFAQISVIVHFYEISLHATI